jgi:hypothetical protein
VGGGGHREAEDHCLFRWVTFGTILLGALQQLSIAPDVPTWVILTLIFNVLVATLTLLVSRRRGKIAMWILIAWFVLNVANAIILIILFESNVIVALGRIRSLQGIGSGVAFGLLFTPSARRWMNREDEKLGEVLH